MRPPCRTLAHVVLLSFSLNVVGSNPGKLLPTAPLARQVIELEKPIGDSPKGTTVESKRRDGLLLRNKISRFIVEQIEVKPDITKDQLTAQLKAILCSDLHGESECVHPPAVFANSWFGPKGTSQFAVAYQLDLGFMGPGGAITVVESYTVEEGRRAQRTSRGGAEFDAYWANFRMVAQFGDPDEIWLLAWGLVLGGSGRGISGRATLYRVGLDAVKIAWDDVREVNVSAQKSLIGWEFSYADKKLLYAGESNAYFLDVYEIDYLKRSFSRVAHYRHSENSL